MPKAKFRFCRSTTGQSRGIFVVKEIQNKISEKILTDFVCGKVEPPDQHRFGLACGGARPGNEFRMPTIYRKVAPPVFMSRRSSGGRSRRLVYNAEGFFASALSSTTPKVSSKTLLRRTLPVVKLYRAEKPCSILPWEDGKGDTGTETLHEPTR